MDMTPDEMQSRLQRMHDEAKTAAEIYWASINDSNVPNLNAWYRAKAEAAVADRKALDMAMALGKADPGEKLDKADVYNGDDPADCHRMAISLIKQAAALCASACGILADGDDPLTAKTRKDLLKYRHDLNRMGAFLDTITLPKEGEKNP